MSARLPANAEIQHRTNPAMRSQPDKKKGVVAADVVLSNQLQPIAFRGCEKAILGITIRAAKVFCLRICS